MLVTDCWLLAPEIHAKRLKDVASFEGMRENKVIGFGLVVGLDASGDKGKATLQVIANMLQRMGVTIPQYATNLKSKNTAAVMVTASLPPYPKPGVKIDVLVSTMADAKSLQGGTLLLTPLKGADNKVYALAQGPISIGGFVGGNGGATVTKNHTTAGRVPEGATIEVEPNFVFSGKTEVQLFLYHPDSTTASDIARQINLKLNDEKAASTVDPSTVKVTIPEAYKSRPVEFMAELEAIDVSVDVPTRVVINERTGTIVIGEAVRISPVAISHGNLTVEIKTDTKVSQPGALAPVRAETVVVPQTNVAVAEPKASLVQISGASLGEVVRALNSLGVTPRDLVSIVQALKVAGALQAQLEII
jgi:flagellar P-ring protein precursor FlgI